MINPLTLGGWPHARDLIFSFLVVNPFAFYLNSKYSIKSWEFAVHPVRQSLHIVQNNSWENLKAIMNGLNVDKVWNHLMERPNIWRQILSFFLLLLRLQIRSAYTYNELNRISPEKNWRISFQIDLFHFYLLWFISQSFGLGNTFFPLTFLLHSIFGRNEIQLQMS